MKRVFLILATLSTTAFAVRTPAVIEATPLPALDPTKVEPYVLKNKSTYALPDEGRAPFWPIGMKTKPVARTTVPTKAGPVIPSAKIPQLKAEHFTVTSVLLGNPALATLNGRSFSQGELVPVLFDGQRLTIKLRTIRDGGVILEQGDNIFFVPLRRQEFVPKPGGDPSPANPQSKTLIIDAAAAAKEEK